MNESAGRWETEVHGAGSGCDRPQGLSRLLSSAILFSEG